MKIEVIEKDDSRNSRWERVVRLSYRYDFHHTAFYHTIDNNYRSILFTAYDEEDFIALPLVIRPIEGTDLYDATSVYGYCGPISSRADLLFSDDLVKYFKSNFQKFCLDNRIVSVFSRLHPLLEQEHFFLDFGEIVPLNKTVAIDLRLKPEEQRRQYRKSNKSEINQLRRKGFTVEEATTQEEIDRFIEIYYETMDRVHATPYYYFSKSYFHDFLSNAAFENRLLVAKLDDAIIAGAIFTVTDKIMQYHLAGTTEEYIRLTPMKLILDEARLLGNSLGPEFLHLGGGVGGSDDDSLFRFKSGFSNHFCQFSVWKYIVDHKTYDSLVTKNGLADRADQSFFPLYRSKK